LSLATRRPSGLDITRPEMALVALAGAWTVAHIILVTTSSSTATINDYWGAALIVLFIGALGLALQRHVRDRERADPNARVGEPFPEPAIARFFMASTGSSALWFVVRMYAGASWALAGWDKITSPTWGTSGKALTGFVTGALAKSTGANPSVQGWYAGFLQHILLNATGLFSFLVTYGEFAVGLGLLFGVLTGIAAGFGVLMNFNYLLAGTVSINPILGMFCLFLCLSWRVCGWVGGDRWVLPQLGMPWHGGRLFHADHAAAGSNGPVLPGRSLRSPAPATPPVDAGTSTRRTR